MDHGNVTNSPARNGSGFLQANPITFPSGMEKVVANVKVLGFNFGMYAPMNPADSDGRNRTIGYEKQDAAYFVSLGANWVKVRVCARGCRDRFIHICIYWLNLALEPLTSPRVGASFSVCAGAE